MLAIISPAKTLDFETKVDGFAFSQPNLTACSQALIDTCKQLSPAEVGSLMSISDKLAGLNVARFAKWQIEHNQDNAKAAIFAFKGDVYTGLDAENLTKEQIEYAQNHLRILSGLYGLLKPLDLMQPYRLEMGTKLRNAKGKDLYAFWGNTITEHLQKAINEQDDHILVNLASDEYYGAVKPQHLNATIVKPIFLDEKNGKYKVISFYAKKARGMMVRFMLEKQPTEIEMLKQFNYGGYWFDEESSTATELIFKREEQ
ncbi:peroxide stress protein YaaA [Mannheimia pernigra]|uniref:UPF0246 protein HV559_06790 n=1 Tax=Mannheimia pernigra TaxID=111844 RepID=A0A7D5I1Z3_9PAST|nr:peroxide stress protein YaaA [Mannheimia pernigra]QLB40597.1 peroxide stress protein YaaA [Mannheimia pernigra]